MLAAAVAAVGLLGAFAAQADDSKRSVGEYTDDKMLVGKVKSALISDKTADADEINVESYKGVVQLNGFVDNAKEKAQAETVAKAVDGVKGVENNLRSSRRRRRPAARSTTRRSRPRSSRR